MTGRGTEADPYWQHDVAIGVPASFDETRTDGIRFKIHQASERFGRAEGRELFPLTPDHGLRTYFHGKPYQRLANYEVTVDLSPAPSPSGEIGVVQSCRWNGFRHRDLGNAQGWYYPASRTLVLWECFLEERYRGGPPTHDTLHRIVWQGWERFLIDHSPGVERIVTTWEDIYDRESWREFLKAQGYRPAAPATFLKVATSA